jgi:SPX domain protein involved in polyphosphate accumulation
VRVLPAVLARWDKLAEKVTSVYDPTKSDFENSASEMAPGGNWWSAPKFEGHNAKTDKWWVHSNAHSKNKAF